MRVAVFSSKPYDQQTLVSSNADGRHDLTFFEARLEPSTAGLAAGHTAVCAFVNDNLSEATIASLATVGVKFIALRCAGYNNVALAACEARGITVARVPAYSPYAVAEHAVAMLLSLNRKIHRAHNRVREHNFSLDGLMGFDVHNRTVGVIGTGRIGAIFARIMRGFHVRLLAYDVFESEDCKRYGVEYVSMDELLTQSDIISLHCPLTPQTRHIVNEASIARMKPGVMIINTSRGALINASAAIAGLKSGKIGYLGLDVYEEEADLFFEDLSDQILADDIFARLQTFPNVLITGHQAYFTDEALRNIADITIGNLDSFASGSSSANMVKL